MLPCYLPLSTSSLAFSLSLSFSYRRDAIRLAQETLNELPPVRIPQRHQEEEEEDQNVRQ